MSKLKKVLVFETAFGSYEVDELLGEGGAGRVYGGVGFDRKAIALKILPPDRATTDKRRRFKNEITFLGRNRHQNVVTVMDHGVSRDGEIVGPFYVMPRFDCNLRDLMDGGIHPSGVLPFFSQVLDGVEAAHLQGAVHRDLKPENILYNRASNVLAIADFGIASFTEDILATLVETDPGRRLANFQYASPEQRRPGGQAGPTADIYALGLILNEMFTGVVPHGTEYRMIGQISADLRFLDPIVAKMLRQAPEDRPASVSDLKVLVQREHSEAVSLQRLSKIDGTVIKSTEVDEPLAMVPPRLIGVDWSNGRLTLNLDRPVSADWVQALIRMPGHTALTGKGPETFSFRGDTATVYAEERQVQPIIDYFKTWLPSASRVLKALLEEKALRQEDERMEHLRLERASEEQRLRVLRNVKI